jgi:hypothetical protein
MEYTMSEKDILMHLESERLKSFENWPFDESCKCTPARVQTNIYFGLYHRPKAQPQVTEQLFVGIRGPAWPWQYHRINRRAPY